MIRTFSTAQAIAELAPDVVPRTVTAWLNAGDDRFLGMSAGRGTAQIKPEPFTLGADYLDRVYCRSVDHARCAEQYSEDMIIITAG
jgi:hypothetical protein